MSNHADGLERILLLLELYGQVLPQNKHCLPNCHLYWMSQIDTAVTLGLNVVGWMYYLRNHSLLPRGQGLYNKRKLKSLRIGDNMVQCLGTFQKLNFEGLSRRRKSAEGEENFKCWMYLFERKLIALLTTFCRLSSRD